MRISEEDYSKLESEALALGLAPAVLARLLLRLSLNEPRANVRRHSRRDVERAVGRLERLATSGQLPSFDAVELVRQTRDARADHIERSSRGDARPR